MQNRNDHHGDLIDILPVMSNCTRYDVGKPKTVQNEQQTLRTQRCKTQSPVLRVAPVSVQCGPGMTRHWTCGRPCRRLLCLIFFAWSVCLCRMKLAGEQNLPSYISFALYAMIDGLARTTAMDSPLASQFQWKVRCFHPPSMPSITLPPLHRTSFPSTVHALFSLL